MHKIRLICFEKDCPFHRTKCCFGEVIAETIPPGGDKIVHVQKCKAKNSRFIRAGYDLKKAI